MVLRWGHLEIQGPPAKALIKILSAAKGTGHAQQVQLSGCRPLARDVCPGEERPGLSTTDLLEERKLF